MAAGFKRHVSCRTPRALASGTKRMNLGMCLTGSLVPAFADDPAILDDDTTDSRIWRRRKHAALSKAQRLRHELMIGSGEHGRY